jgi:hypothetical protein
VERDTLLRLFRALADEGVAYVLVGGLAVNLHGVIRATEDVDLFVRPDQANVERLRAALKRVFDDDDIDEISADDLAGQYPVVRYVPPGAGPSIDLVARLGERVAYADLEAEERDVDGVPVRLATPRTLYRLKRDTARPIDAQDAVRLRDAFALEEDD